MRTTRVSTELSRLAESWITVAGGGAVQINARLGTNFRVFMTMSATLEPPFGPHSGQVICLRVEQNETGGWTLAPSTALVFRNGAANLGISTAALAVSFVYLRYDDELSQWEVVTPTSNAGTVTSVNVSLPGATSAGAVTTAGTVALTWNNEAPNVVFAGPTSGAPATPTWRILVAADIPDLSATYLPLHGTADAALGAPPTGSAGGDLTGTYPNPTVDTNKITYAKMQQVSAISLLLGRGSAAGAGNVQEITLGTTLAMSTLVLNVKRNTGWTAGTHSVLKSLSNGASLSDTQDFLISLVEALIAGGMPSA